MTIKCSFKGRLGNQLFQYAALRSLSLCKNYKMSYDFNFNWHGQDCLLKFFNIPESNTHEDFYSFYNQPENSFYFDENFFNLPDNTIINGHFENELYFQNYQDIIKKELVIKDEKINKFCDNFLTDIKEDNFKIVGIHFRRGDLVSQVNSIEYLNNIMINFVNKSLDDILKYETKIKLLLFTGGFRKNNDFNNNTHEQDLEWIYNLQNNIFNKYEVILSPGSISNKEIIDYCLLTKTDINIISISSTFGWMASYINNSNEIYFNDKYNNLYNNLKSAQKFKNV